MVCPHCDRRIPDGSEKCEYCGLAIVTESPAKNEKEKTPSILLAHWARCWALRLAVCCCTLPAMWQACLALWPEQDWPFWSSRAISCWAGGLAGAAL